MIRPAVEEDIPKIEQLMRSEPGFWNDDWPDAVLRKAIRVADGLAFVWDERDRILGFICAHNLGFRGYLSELIVSKDAREKNIGSGLLERVERELKSQGCPIIISDVWKTAEPFYCRMGWTSPDVILLIKRIGK